MSVQMSIIVTSKWKRNIIIIIKIIANILIIIILILFILILIICPDVDCNHCKLEKLEQPRGEVILCNGLNREAVDFFCNGFSLQ